MQDEVVPQIARRGWLLGAAAWAGCNLSPDEDHRGPDTPASAPLARPPRVAWVLSSGGPRGFVHVGVIKALDELKLAPDLIVGASVGAFVAVLRGAGVGGLALERMALDLQPWQLARINLGSGERLSGAAIADFVRDLVRLPLQRLPLPVVCVAQRLADGQVVGFNQGDAGLAVQASSAIEGQFSPVRIRGQRYADADQRMPLPVRIARSLGAARVLAVDASAHESKAPPGAEGYRDSDRRKRELTEPDARLADVLLHPEFGYWVSLSREFRERSIAAGYAATMAAADRLRSLHADVR